MATLHEYFETDFNNVVKMHVLIEGVKEKFEGVVLCDFVAYISYLAVYIPGQNRTREFFEDLLKEINYGNPIGFNNRVTLPAAKSFPGQLNFVNNENFEISAKFHGEQEWKNYNELQASRRVFFYTETQLNDQDLKTLKDTAKQMGHDLQFRSENYRATRANQESPLAFISHDSRDKEVALAVATTLNKMMCPVWYDEFSLKVGDNLRQSIEKGLKECKKCVLIISPNFIANNGWTQVEFDSIFTRQIIEEQKLLLPIWLGVTKQQVYQYSPSLLNVLAINWDPSKESELIGKLHRSITD